MEMQEEKKEAKQEVKQEQKEDFEWLLKTIAEKIDNFTELNLGYDD